MNALLQRMGRDLLADRKKLSIMAVLALVGLLLWGRLLLRQVPRSAVARPPAADAAPASAPEPAARPSPAAEVPIVYVDLPDRLRRDLFQLDPGAFEKLPAQAADPDAPDAKSPPVAADVSEAAKVRADMAVALQALRLEGTMGGQPPRAVINGQLLVPGEAINGFVVDQIRSRVVRLKFRGLAVELSMSANSEVRPR